MNDALPKNNTPKLKWWHKGALVGFGIALITSFIVVLAAQSASYFPGSAIMLIFVELPVLPIFILVGSFLSTILPSLETDTTLFALLAHFISWTLGGIVYAYIFHIIRRLTKRK